MTHSTLARLLIALTCLALCSCGVVGQYQRYERPELFYPPAEKLRQQLAQAPAAPPAPGIPAAPPVVPAAPSPTPLEILMPTELAAGDAVAHDIRVSDTCTAPQVPAISVEPAGALVGNLALEPGTTTWFKTTFNLSRLAPAPRFIGDLEITVISCQAGGLSATRARALGLLKTVRVAVGYKRLLTRFNIWSDADVAEEFGAEFARTFIAADAVFENPNANPILVYGSSLAARVRFLAAKDDVRRVLGQKAIDNPALLDNYMWDDVKASNALDFKEYYRPLSYSDILAIFSFQKESDPRARAISSLKSVGELAAGAAVFVSGVDYSKGVALFTGVLIPELEKQLLWDVLGHLKNLEQRSLKEVEEIAERGQVRRVVFFPRRALPNFLPPFPMYVAEIRPDDVPVKAVLIEKQATISN